MILHNVQTHFKKASRNYLREHSGGPWVQPGSGHPAQDSVLAHQGRHQMLSVAWLGG